MLTKFKKSISEKIISLIENNERNKKNNSWQSFLALENINIHPSFNPKNATIFKGENNLLGHLTIGENVLLREYCNVLVFPNAKLIIGKGVFFNNYCTINCLEKIEIGDDTIFGEGVKLYDHNHLINKGTNFHVEKEKYTKSPIKIGKNCWIGSNVVILKGITIGDNAIIGAGCIIHKSVPANTIVKNNQNLIYESL
ncbi:Acetyltransferase (isoleucine patch superfamily) [Chryseobacterium soldanellicola]|uniref:Acetyltransferase (Isoleucine patch superfamily) n=1 Tax=Chryseobacterium soldanellicola TaxID=311333 RepID=A0A1H1A6W2_9FLAO|nr:acyltransferase [Chryseobacterium soldanellicola]SDQ35394.1 Acetyltransferase (isoleucine patch superfamily) [Chryseobacterium soldanellicola]